MENIVVIGGGLAGHRAAGELWRLSGDARIHVISAEPEMPYDRPPLSKDFLHDASRGATQLSGQNIYERITFEPGVRAVRIDRQKREVHTSQNSVLSYDRLLIATGSRNRRLTTFEQGAEIHYLRTLAEARTLRQKLCNGRKLLIVGGGFIGLEVATAAHSLGCDVTIAEASDRLLNRAGSDALSTWAYRYYTRMGAQVLLSAQIASVRRSAGRILATTIDGKQLETDIVLVGIGVQPNVELAFEAGLEIDDGIVVDEHCATSDPSIYAAGEVTSYPIDRLKARFRTESWTAAGDQAIIAARCMLGGVDIYSDMPWLWSDQGTHNIQCWGFPGLASKKSIVESLGENRWLEIGLSKSGDVISAVGVNMGREISMLRRAVKSGKSIPTPFALAV